MILKVFPNVGPPDSVTQGCDLRFLVSLRVDMEDRKKAAVVILDFLILFFYLHI